MKKSQSCTVLSFEDSPKAVSAGDGSEAAYQRIRTERFQAGTVPEPLNMQGWQIVDEMNRAFNKAAWSGYSPKVHLVTAENVGKDGGPKSIRTMGIGISTSGSGASKSCARGRQGAVRSKGVGRL